MDVERQRRLRMVFDRMDLDHSGRLSESELRWGLRELGVKATVAEIAHLAHRMDLSGDDVISYEEFAAFLGQLPNVNAVAVFELFQTEVHYEDANGEYTPAHRASGRRLEARGAGSGSKEQESLLSAVAAKLYCGCIAGVASRTATAPIDRLRMVMQTSSGGEGLVQVARGVWAEGGARSFFRGNGVNCLKIAPETALKFVGFDYLRTALSADPSKPTMLERFAAGGAAGAFAQCLIYPLEIARTRLAISPKGTYTGLADVLRKTVASGGPGALFRGIGPSIMGIVPYAGVDLATNSLLKEVVGAHLQRRGLEPGVPLLLGCGMASSTTAMMLTYPLNLVRTRMQASGMPGAVQYGSSWDCFRQTVAVDGFRGLYRGVGPNLLKVMPATSISYTIYGLL